MQVWRWFRAPRHLFFAFLILVLLPAVTLGWVGLRFLEQQRELVDQRIRERLESAADLLEENLRRNRSDLTGRLAGLAALTGGKLEDSLGSLALELDGAVLVRMKTDQVEAYPAERLIFYPHLNASKTETTPAVLVRAEELEFRSGKHLQAAAEFRRFSSSADPVTRAYALNGLARNLRKAGRSEEALAAYRDLEESGHILIAGSPAELLARVARTELLREIDPLEAETLALALTGDLRSGRWKLSRSAYLFYAQQLGSNTPGDPCQEGESPALADGVERVWDIWQRLRREDGESSGFLGQRLGKIPVLLAWHAVSEQMVALVGGPRYLEGTLLADTAPVLQRYGAQLALTDSEGQLVTGAVASPETPQLIARVADEDIPWNLHLAAADPETDYAELAGRQRLVFSSMALMALLVVGGGYLVAGATLRELEDARLKSDFVDAVSHQFRTPLTIMRQLTEMLAGGRLVSDARRQKYYDVLVSETSRLQRLVESLLSFGSLEAGLKEYHYESVDVVALVLNVVEDFQKEIQEHGYRIQASTPPGELYLRADPEALQRVLWNLLDNAVKYSPANKSIGVEMTDVDHGISVRVRDQGVGIKPSEQKKIFRKFFRGEAARTSGVRGTGIGLAMVRHIVSDHGGHVRVDSKPGRGSIFTIFLPKER